MSLPDGVLVGHWTDVDAWTGCTVCMLPEGSVASCEVRGGAPGTLGSDILQPSSVGPGAHAILLTGGSAFGLAAVHGVSRWLQERGVGFPTPAARVPLVPAAVVYDLGLGSSEVRPSPDAGYAACDAASAEPGRGSVGVGTGCTVGKLLGADGWILAGIRSDEGYVPTAEAVRGAAPELRRPWSEATTLVCVVTDVALTKLEAWMCARAANAGVARAVTPVWTPFDGDTVFCASTGRVQGDVLALSLIVADLVADAIRDGVREATGAPGCPAAGERRGLGRRPL